MSQYRVKVKNIEYQYGYDEQLQEYFLGAFDLTKNEDEDDCIYGIGNYFNTIKPHPEYPGKIAWSNGELLAFISKYKYPISPGHLEKLAMDLPF